MYCSFVEKTDFDGGGRVLESNPLLSFFFLLLQYIGFFHDGNSLLVSLLAVSVPGSHPDTLKFEKQSFPHAVFLCLGVHSTAHHHPVLPLLLLRQQQPELPPHQQPVGGSQSLHPHPHLLLLPQRLLPRREHDRVRAQLHREPTALQDS